MLKMLDQALRHAIVAVVVAACWLPIGTLADDVADDYRGETITLVVGYGAGGGFDAVARMIAPWIERRTGATVVVENRPGGGGLVALNQVYDADPDGRTLILANGMGALMGQLLGIDGVRFDLGRMSVIGRLTTEPSAIMISRRSGHATIADLVASDAAVKWSGGGKTDGLADGAACVSRALGLDARIIIGYKGARESALAAMRGEVDAVVSSATSAMNFSSGGELSIAAVIARERFELLPEVPTLFEASGASGEDAWWIDLWIRVSTMGRVLLTTPGVAPQRLDYLRSVIADIVADPDFLAEATERRRVIRYLAPAPTEALVRELLGGMSADEIAQVQEVVLHRYY